MARRYPISNFLGLERQRERVERARRKIARLGLGNAAVLHGDGLDIVARLPDACADCVHVLFPDPWPKRRHEVRRIVSEEFLGEVLRILKVHGSLRLVTDDLDYARAMVSRAAGMNAYQRIENDLRVYPPTEFQIKFVADSRPFYAFLFVRLS